MAAGGSSSIVLLHQQYPAGGPVECYDGSMNASALKAKIGDATGRLSKAEAVMERAIRQIDLAAREEKSIIAAALASALAELKAARQDLLALEQVIAET